MTILTFIIECVTMCLRLLLSIISVIGHELTVSAPALLSRLVHRHPAGSFRAA